MTVSSLPVPSATEDPNQHADWLELNSLCAADGNSSIRDLAENIGRSGTTEGLSEEDDLSADVVAEDADWGVAESAFERLEERFKACGGEAGYYPFSIGENHIQLRPGVERSVYIFLLLLSKFGHDCGPPGLDGADLFEDTCARAAESYFGGAASGTKFYRFGFPRRESPRQFSKALDDLCRKMGEGEGHQERLSMRNQKDAGVDIVVWRDFPDCKQGKVIALAQCASGNNWREKLTDLQPVVFCSWMRQQPAVSPVRAFFTPRQVDGDDWYDVCLKAGIVFDRCRIAYYSGLAQCALSRNHKKWCDRVVARQRR